MNESWGRRLSMALIVMIVLVAALYAGDCVVLRVRIAHGTAYGSVEIHQFLATSLKDNKTEYDLVGTFQQPCTRSIFPQKGMSACWWLQRHSSQWE
jgi:hypothetical protein